MMPMHQTWEATNPDWSSETCETDISVLPTPISPLPLHHAFNLRTEYMGNKLLMSLFSPLHPVAWISTGYTHTLYLPSRIILLWPIPESHEPEAENRELVPGLYYISASCLDYSMPGSEHMHEVCSLTSPEKALVNSGKPKPEYVAEILSVHLASWVFIQ